MMYRARIPSALILAGLVLSASHSSAAPPAGYKPVWRDDFNGAALDVTDGTQVSINGSMLTIHPSANLPYSKNHAVRISTGAIEDLAGNPFAGIGDDTTWNFTTATTLVDPATPAGSLPVSGGTTWQLVFSDEFNASSLNSAKWGVDVSTKSRAARTDRGIDDWWWKAANVSLDGIGNLVLDVTKHDANTMYCGSISSDGLFEPTYGYMEARIKIADTTKDTHTAFWLQSGNMIGNPPDDNTAYDGAEIDIFESAWFSDYTKAVVHIDGYGADKQASTKQYSTPGLHSGYHVFGMEWTADSLKIYYDGALKATYTGIWVPQVPEWLWLSCGASFGDIGTFASEPAGWLTSAQVDYVRYWQASPLDHFAISPIASPQTVGTPINGITITAQDSDDQTVTDFTGTVTFGGSGGFSGTSASFTAGVLTGMSVTPTVAGNDLTLTVDDGAGHTGTTSIPVIQTQYDAWSGGAVFNGDSNGDGVDNGMAWVLGAANPAASVMLPTASRNAGALRLSFRCLKSSERGGMQLKIQHSNDLGQVDPWSNHEAEVPDADGTVNGVVFDTTDDGDFINVVADIPTGGERLFARLSVAGTD